VNCCWSG